MQLSVHQKSAFYGTDQKVLKRENLDALQRKKEHVRCWLLARQMCYVFIIYGHFQRTAVDLKQLINTQSKHAFSFGPDADYRCHKTWNLITSTLSFDAMSCLQSSANTWLWHLGSAGLSADGNCHFVSMRGSEVHVWGGNIRSGICESCSWHIKSSGCTFFHTPHVQFVFVGLNVSRYQILSLSEWVCWRCWQCCVVALNPFLHTCILCLCLNSCPDDINAINTVTNNYREVFCLFVLYPHTTSSHSVPVGPYGSDRDNCYNTQPWFAGHGGEFSSQQPETLWKSNKC